MTVNQYYLDDLVPGQRFGSKARLRIDADRIKAFAAEFDPQPFHLDEDSASATMRQSRTHLLPARGEKVARSAGRPEGSTLGV